MIHKFRSVQIEQIYSVLSTWNSSQVHNNTVPILIPTFNNPTYLKQMIDQLQKYNFEEIWIIDNGSTYEPMTNLLNYYSSSLKILVISDNPSPSFLIRQPELLRALPKYFVLTDPDIKFNTNLPASFIEILIEISEKYKYGKVGFALDISETEILRKTKFEISGSRYRIWEWEKQFWQNKLRNTGSLEIYEALIDTTFALYNKDYYSLNEYTTALRVSGIFCAKHLPWYKSSLIPRAERKYYKKSQMHSYYGLEISCCKIELN